MNNRASIESAGSARPFELTRSEINRPMKGQPKGTRYRAAAMRKLKTELGPTQRISKSTPAPTTELIPPQRLTRGGPQMRIGK